MNRTNWCRVPGLQNILRLEEEQGGRAATGGNEEGDSGPGGTRSDPGGKQSHPTETSGKLRTTPSKTPR